MLIAMPSRNSSLSQHFAKAPQIMLWDSQANSTQILDLPKSSACCSHKKYWSQVLKNHKVDAVVIRSIGTNMLNTLFKLKVRVLSAPRGFDLNTFDVNQLTPVTQITFARPSAKKNKSCCSGHNVIPSLSGDMPPPTSQSHSVNKLSPRAMNHLNKVLKLTTDNE